MTNDPKTRREIAEGMAPGFAEMFEERYGDLLPEVGEIMADWLFADHYAREGLDLKTRKIVSVVSLASLGGQTKVQLALNIRKALKAGATEVELAEALWQIGIYAGTPAAISALNTLMEILEEEKSKSND